MPTSEELKQFLADLALHPAMYAGTPESAHGMFVAIWSIISSSRYNRLYEECLKETLDIVKHEVGSIGASECQGVLLCDEVSGMNRIVSMEAFQVNATKLLKLL